MIIVLDTNIIRRLPFGNPSFIALFDLLARSEDDSLVIPQVVIDEEINLCREALIKIQHSVNEQAREFQRWTSKKSSFHLDEEQIREAIAAHDLTLKETVQRVGASIRPYPKISHELLVAKCLARKKPFTEDGQKGYRDALIWASLVEILIEQSPEEVAFITNNTKDFFEKDKERLHPHLLEDLAHHAIHAERISIFKDLAEFVDHYVQPTLEELDARSLESIRANFAQGLGKYAEADIKDAVLQALRAYHDKEDEVSPHEVGLPSEVETVRITYVEDVTDLHAEDARKLSSGVWFITGAATVLYALDFFIYKADDYVLEEDPSLEVNDSDWNEHYIWAQAVKSVKVTISLTFDERAGTVTALEVKAFAPFRP